MEKISEFVNKNWKWIMIAIIVIVVIAYFKKKKSESDYEGWAVELDQMPESGFRFRGVPCVDCGPGGMFGPGWTKEKFEKKLNELKKRARELSGGISGEEFEQAIKRAGGLISYIEGRETNIKRIEEATDNLKDVMNIPGVHGLGSMMNGVIEIAVIDEATKQKVFKFIEEKKKAILMIPSHGAGFMGHPVKIVIREQAKAQPKAL